jgi:hypothetical protein
VSIHFTVKFINKCLDHFWFHQLMPQSIQDLGFQCISAHRQQIAIDSLVTGGGAAVMGLADFGEPATAGPAPEERLRRRLQRNFNHVGVRSFILTGAPLTLCK